MRNLPKKDKTFADIIEDHDEAKNQFRLGPTKYLDSEALDGDDEALGPVASACRMLAATVLLGVGAGVIGIGVTLLIKNVQILGFGHADGGFLTLAEQASSVRRFITVTFAGVFSAVGWFWLRGREPAFVPVEECMKGAKMPPTVTLLNGAIQDIAVALGGSFGREAAPREISAMFGCVLADHMHVTQAQRRILVACGTGAGLAAVYSVPISGVMYTIEHILDWDVSLGALIPAVLTCTIATAVSYTVVETDGLYHMPRYSKEWPSLAIIIWAFLIGPMCGVAAALFSRMIKFARGYRPAPRFSVPFKDANEGEDVQILWRSDEGSKTRHKVHIQRKEAAGGLYVRFDNEEVDQFITPQEWDSAKPLGRRNWHILIGMPAAFLALATLSIRCPSLLGNGRAMAEVAIHRLQHGRSVAKLIVMFFFKICVTAAAIASGVDGGTLTPSVAIGATLGSVIGVGWQETWAIGPPREDEKAIIASVAFLAPAMRSPVTGLWLIVEFCAQGIFREELRALVLHGDSGPLLESKFAIGMLLPMCIADIGAMLMFTWLMSTGEVASPVQVDESPKDTLAPLTFDRVNTRQPTQSAGGASDLDLGVGVVKLRRTMSATREAEFDTYNIRAVHPEEVPLAERSTVDSFELRSPILNDIDEEDGMNALALTQTTPSLSRASKQLVSTGTQTIQGTCHNSCLHGFMLLLGLPRGSR